MLRLSTHITQDIFEYSNNHPNIPNHMDSEQTSNAVLLCNTILEPIITKVGMRVDSGYRCPELNLAVGGSLVPLSQHCLGQACDILPVNGMPLIVFFNKIRSLNLPFDQLILEFTWVHISYSGKNMRHEIFQAYKDNKNKTLYKTI